MGIINDTNEIDRKNNQKYSNDESNGINDKDNHKIENNRNNGNNDDMYDENDFFSEISGFIYTLELKIKIYYCNFILLFCFLIKIIIV